MNYKRKIRLALFVFAISVAGQVSAIDFTEVVGDEAEALWISTIYDDAEGNDRIFHFTVRVSSDAVPQLKLSEFERKDPDSIWTWKQVNEVEQRIDAESIGMDYDNLCKTLSLSMDATGNRRIKFFQYGDVDMTRFEGFDQWEGFVLDEKQEGSWISGEASLPWAGKVSAITELVFFDGDAFQLNQYLVNLDYPERGFKLLMRIEGTSAMSDGVLKTQKVFRRNMDGSWNERRETRFHEEPIRVRHNGKCNQLTLIIPQGGELYSVVHFSK